jgi:hypothetical protein
MNIQGVESFPLSLYDVSDQLKQHIYERSERAFEEGNKARDLIQDAAGLAARKAYMLQHFKNQIGGLPSSESPLHGQVTGVLVRNGYKIEKIIFEARPQAYVTGSLYIPDHVKPPCAAVLFVCGHTKDSRMCPTYQAVCQYLVLAGLIVFAVDPVGQGERLGYYESEIGMETVGYGTEEHDHVGSQCWPIGDSLARYFIHDNLRAIDYLCSRPEVDPARIGITGNSGGGLQTVMAMMLDPRIAAAAPGTFLSSRESYIYAGQSQDAEQIWPGMSALGFDHEDVCLAFAPRPLLVLAVSADFFPIEGTRQTVERSKRFWELLGKPSNLELFEDISEHKYTVPMAKRAAAFFAEHLLGKSVELEGIETAPLCNKDLFSTRTGQVRGDYPDSRWILDENKTRLAELEKKRLSQSDDTMKLQATAWLRSTVHEQRQPMSLNPRFVDIGHVHECKVIRYVWWSQRKLFSHAYLLQDSRMQGKEQPLIIGLWKHGTRDLKSHMGWIRQQFAEGRSVLVLDVSGEGALVPNSIHPNGLYGRFGTFYKLTTDLFWLNDSLAALRCYDVIRAIAMAKQEMVKHGAPIQLYAKEGFGLYALAAKLLDENGSIEKVKLASNEESIRDWMISRHYQVNEKLTNLMPGMLHYFDIPDLIRWTQAEIVGH